MNVPEHKCECQVERVMCALYVRKLHLWSRFQSDASNHQGAVTT